MIAEALVCAEVTANGSVTVLFALMVDGFPVNTSLGRAILNVTAGTRREFGILSIALLLAIRTEPKRLVLIRVAQKYCLWCLKQ